MKTGTLRIGNKGEGKHVKIPFQEPETVAEFKDVFGDNEQFLLDCAMRGVRIRIQDLTRDNVAEGLKAGKSPETVVTETLDFLENTDITEKKERKAPAPRKPVVLPEGKQEFSRAELEAMLSAAGVKIATDAEAPATPA